MRLRHAPAVVAGLVIGGLAALLDLVADDAQFLVQHQLALGALQALLHLEAYLLLDLEHGRLLGQGLKQRHEALMREAWFADNVNRLDMEYPR